MRLISILLCTLALTAPAGAQVSPLAQDYIVPSLGYFDVGADDNSAVQLGIEYRMAPRIWVLRPTFGFNVSSDESLYGYAGVNADIDMAQIGVPRLWLTPSFVVGAYENGDGKSLGGTIQFRTGLELSYDIYYGQRVGVAFTHTSNAGFYDQNPGAETLLINYHVPFNRLF